MMPPTGARTGIIGINPFDSAAPAIEAGRAASQAEGAAGGCLFQVGHLTLRARRSPGHIVLAG